MIAIIAAMTEDRVIGNAGAIPWHLPEDMALFKKLTTGHTVIMGRKTYESLGRPLPNRRNLVVSRTMKTESGLEIFNDLESAVRYALETSDTVFLIGGEKIYREGLKIADTMYLSIVKTAYTGDTYFPEFDRNKWNCSETKDYSDFTLTVWQKRGSESI